MNNLLIWPNHIKNNTPINVIEKYIFFLELTKGSKNTIVVKKNWIILDSSPIPLNIVLKIKPNKIE